MEGSRILTYLQIDIGIKSQCTAIRAVAVLMQISLTTVSPTFKVDYLPTITFTRMSLPTLKCFLVF